MIKSQLTIINKLGLHARAATKLANTAGNFCSSIRVGRDDSLVDAKSVMAVMLLAAPQSTVLTFEFDGGDEQHAHQTINTLIEDFFGEGE
jgi:phosphocarrier protein HPr